MKSMDNDQRIAVLIPCKDEELTVAKVINDFKSQLPDADIYVFDNNSTDLTYKKAQEAGATVIKSHKQGKGNVIKHMFAVVEAEIYIMTDGDDTYPAEEVHKLLDTFNNNNYDMVVGTRLDSFEKHAFRSMHKYGNRFISSIITKLFSADVKDALSGYRIFSRNLVKNLFLRSNSFEIETEITLQTIINGFHFVEIPVMYRERPKGSVSKLNTYKDGFHIIRTIGMIFRDYKPLFTFSMLGLIVLILSLFAGFYPISDFIREQYVYHVPLAILAASLFIMSMLFFGIGIILNTINNFHIETTQRLKNINKKG